MKIRFTTVRMLKICALSTVSVVLLTASTCWPWGKPPQTVNATVSCGSFGRVDSDLGLLNTAQLSLGTLLRVDDKNPEVARVKTVVPAATNGPTAEIATSHMAKNANFDVSLDASVPATVDAAFRNALKSQTEFDLVNVRRIEVSDVISEANGNQQILNELRQAPNALYLYGQAVFLADRADVKLSRGATGSANVNVFKYGKYVFNINYACAQEINNTAAKGAPMFWKFTKLTYDPVAQRVILSTQSFDPNAYSWGPAFQVR